MKTCPKCAEQVQDEATVCRYCGHSFQIGVTAITAGCVGTVFLLTLLAFGVRSCFHDFAPPAAPTNERSFEQQMADAGKVVRIERLVKARLRDPQSATFRHLNGGCGFVNSKNGFGGFTGETQFIVGANDKVVFRSDGPGAFATVWEGHCVKGLTP